MAGSGAPQGRRWRLRARLDVQVEPLEHRSWPAIRDQVITDRNDDPTTLQLLELVNGTTLDKLLYRGAARMLGELRPAPANLFDSGLVTSNKAEVDIDITGVRRLRLLLTDTDSYNPSLIVAGWANAELIGP